MNDPMQMFSQINQMSERLQKLAKPGEDTFAVFARVVGHFEQNPPTEAVPEQAAPLATPSTPLTPPTQSPTQPTPLTPAQDQPAAAVYRFKDGAAIENVMSDRYGRNWAGSMGINQMDLMRLIGTTPGEESIQKQLDSIFRQGDGRVGNVTVKTARGLINIPISQLMLERVES